MLSFELQTFTLPLWKSQYPLVYWKPKAWQSCNSPKFPSECRLFYSIKGRSFLNESPLLYLKRWWCRNSKTSFYKLSNHPNMDFLVFITILYLRGVLPNMVVVAHPICLTVVFSRHLKRWWCCSSKTSSLKFSSKGKPAALAAILASAAFFLDTNAAPEVAFAIWMRASRAFCKYKK